MNIDEVNRCLSQFAGSAGRIVKYSDGFEVLRLELATEHRRCEILCKGCRHIASPTTWESATLQVIRVNDELVELRANADELRILCWLVACTIVEDEPDAR